MFSTANMAWAGGVLDACGRFQLRVRKGEVVGAEVFVNSSRREVCEGLAYILGGDTPALGTWSVGPDKQKDILIRAIPHMRCAKQIEKARRIVLFRSTQGGTRLGKPVHELRKSLAEDEKVRYPEESGLTKWEQQ